MTFDSEREFESAVIECIRNNGWKKYPIIPYPTEEELVTNWKEILSDNNKDRDCLNGEPLTDTEMQQVIDQVNACRTPLEKNRFINGKGITIIRDNPADTLHLGKTVTLEIYDRRKIEGGKSVYQIARQPKFKAPNNILPDRRGDFMLLINGMPVIHVELKKSGVDVQVACNQIELYSHEGIFARGIFSLVQVFVAMQPKETVYFANPGQGKEFDPKYFFHWADVNNKPINEWNEVVRNLLNIPMAHLLIGYYTVADKREGSLKVMRSYQYYAASFIKERVAGREDWKHADRYGGYVWHATGSGKTMTSFKAALLISEFGYADKVVFLVDRIELNEQSFGEYQSFADDGTDIQDTASTSGLITKLKSPKREHRLIISSINKMSNVRRGKVRNESDIDAIQKKRIVFIVDECHRSTFGKMLTYIKNTFPTAMFFGFTGTPIKEENQRKDMTTAGLFGEELHKYTLGGAIRDKNVLPFDPYIECYDDDQVRQAVALREAKAATPEEALSDPRKAKRYMHFMQDVPMGYYIDAEGNKVSGIEDYLPSTQYEGTKHHEAVVATIKKGWVTVSYNNLFHAILATHSIAEAIDYYYIVKRECPNIKCTAIFDEQEDYAGNMTIKKEDALLEIVTDYNSNFGKKFDLKHYDQFLKDVSCRLAHKEPYQNVEPQKQLNLVIVVDMLLTGYDSHWVNALYLDKKLESHRLIQALSRTNRLNGPIKKFGIIKCFRYPHTMERNIERAVDLYSRDEPLELFVNKLPRNLQAVNSLFSELQTLFKEAGIDNFERLPDDEVEQERFAKAFKQIQGYIDSAKLQGFVWEKREYNENNSEGIHERVYVELDYNSYVSLLNRYKELAASTRGGGRHAPRQVPFAIDTYISQIRMDAIDGRYIDDRFGKFLHAFNTDGANAESTLQVKEQLHTEFATLTATEQKYAYLIISDIQKGMYIDEGKSFRDLLIQYQSKAESEQIHVVAKSLGVDEQMLRELVRRNVNEQTIDDKGSFSELKEKADISKAKEYFERSEKQKIDIWIVKIKLDRLLREFLFADDARKEAIAEEILCTSKSKPSEYPEYEQESLMAAEPFECYKWQGFDRSIRDCLGENQTILIGCYKGKKYQDWILTNKLYNIRLGKTKGSMEANRELFDNTSLLILYELGKPNKLSAYKITGHQEMNKEDLLKLDYPNKKPRKSYMAFSITPLDMDLTFLAEHHLIERLVELNANNAKGTPVFIEP